MNLRESYAATELQSHAHSDLRETPIDRIAAAGLCNPLGIMLWKAKYSHDSVSYINLEHALWRMCRAKYPNAPAATLRKAVEQSLRESLSPDICLTCNGLKGVTIDHKWVVCTKCDGTGVQRYSDLRRSRGMQISLKTTEYLTHKIRYCINVISKLDFEVNGEMNRQLERT